MWKMNISILVIPPTVVYLSDPITTTTSKASLRAQESLLDLKMILRGQ